MTTNSFIEFFQSGKKETFAVNNLKNTQKHMKSLNYSGQVNVYTKSNLLFNLTFENGILNGKCIKYVDYVPSTWSGTISGYITRNWRQPEIELTIVKGVITGQATVYNKDGTRNIILNFSEDKLNGDQKHYFSNIVRVLHTFENGVWKGQTIQYKNWLPRWNIEIDEVSSHFQINSAKDKIIKIFK